MTSLASIASLEMLATGYCDAQADLILVHSASAGPPFAVGDEIMCNAGEDQLQKVFVLEAEYPRYHLRLADGTTILDTCLPIR